MTVPSAISSVEYTGNGATVDFPVPFFFLEDEHLVVRVTPLGGAEVMKTLGVDYTVAGADDPAGGTVTFLSAPDVDDAIVIEREVPVVQDTSFRTQGAFSPATHEEALDYRTFVDQQLERRVTALEASATTNDATAGNGISVSMPSTWHVGAGDGITTDADSVHVNFSATTPLVSDAGAGDVGTAVVAAREDHKHSVKVAAPGAIAIGDAAAEGSALELARADHVHELVAPGAPVDVTKAAADAGASTAPAREDHKHDVSTAAAVELTDAANAEGAATSLARSDHTHAHGNRGGGTLHAEAVAGGDAGFLSGDDKMKLDHMGDTFSGTVRTNDATPTEILAVGTNNNTVTVIEAHVSAMKSTNDTGAGFVVVGTFRNTAGVATQLGATTALAGHADAGAAGWSVAFVTSGGDVSLEVTGAAATIINWRAQARACEAP